MTKNIFTRLSMFILAFVACMTQAFADNKIYLDNVRVGYGETVTVPVYFDNTDAVIGLQFDIVLPKGLKYVEESVKQNTSRALVRNYGVSAVEQESNVLRVLLTSKNFVAIPAGEGAIVYVDLQADDNLPLESAISITGAVAGDNTGVNKAEVAAGDPTTVTNTDLAMTIEPSLVCGGESEITVNPGDEFVVDFVLNNDKLLYGMQGEIIIPEGLEIVPGIEGNFIYTDRIPEQYAIAENDVDGVKRFVIASTEKGAQLVGTEGVFFSIKLKATEAMSLDSKMVLRKLIVVGKNNSKQTVDAEAVITIAREGVPGDVNGDKECDVRDIDALYSAIMSGEAGASYDANGDGDVDVRDIDYIYSIILGL